MRYHTALTLADIDGLDHELVRRLGAEGYLPPIAGGEKNDDDDKDDKDKGGKDDDDDTGEKAVSRDEFRQLQTALRESRKETKDLKDELNAEREKAKEDDGKFEELYKDQKKATEELQGEIDSLKAEGTKKDRAGIVRDTATRLKFRNPGLAVKLVDLDKIEDDADAERALKALARDDKYLLTEEGRRQRPGAGRDDDSTDDGKGDGDDDTDNGKKTDEGEVFGTARLRRAYENADKAREKDKAEA